MRWSRSVQTLRRDAALLARIHYPIVELERMHRLQNGADTSHIAVDLRVAKELGGQVGVEARLNGGRCVDPKRWIEEDVVEQLPREKRKTEKLVPLSVATVLFPGSESAECGAKACSKTNNNNDNIDNEPNTHSTGFFFNREFDSQAIKVL